MRIKPPAVHILSYNNIRVYVNKSTRDVVVREKFETRTRLRRSPRMVMTAIRQNLKKKETNAIHNADEFPNPRKTASDSRASVYLTLFFRFRRLRQIFELAAVMVIRLIIVLPFRTPSFSEQYLQVCIIGL